MTESTPAPYPGDTRAKGWRFELDHERIKQSDTWAVASPDARPWLLMLWMTAWEQTPCGSLPDSDELIAARIGMSSKVFTKHRSVLMRGWWKAVDGRLYHQTLTERVCDMLVKRAKDAKRAADNRARRAGVVVDPPGITGVSRVTPVLLTGEFDTKHQAPEEEKEITEPSVLVAGTAYRPPPSPNAEIAELYRKHLPMLPGVEVLNEGRKRAIAARWREVCGDGKLDRDAGLEWFDWYFGHAAKSKFLTGQMAGKSGRVWQADFDFLMTSSKFAKVIEGSYHREAA